MIKKLSEYKKILKFLVIGGLSTLIDFMIYFILSNFIGITISKMISMITASIFSFFYNKNWTFTNRDKISIKIILKYILCQCLNIFINVTSNNLIYYYVLKNKIVSFIFATMIAMIFNFCFQNFVVFKKIRSKYYDE